MEEKGLFVLSDAQRLVQKKVRDEYRLLVKRCPSARLSDLFGELTEYADRMVSAYGLSYAYGVLLFQEVEKVSVGTTVKQFDFPNEEHRVERVIHALFMKYVESGEKEKGS